MRLSEKRRQAVYQAIYEFVTDLRIKAIKGRDKDGVPFTDVDLDNCLFRLTDEIFADVLAALDAEAPR